MHKNLFLVLFSLIIIISSCDKKDNNPSNADTDTLIGKYETTEPVLIKIKTDWCTSQLEEVATIKWDITWEITKSNVPNTYNIKMTFYPSDYTVVNSQCTDGTGYVPEPSPMYLSATRNNNELTVIYAGEVVGIYDIQEESLKGDLKYSYCIGYCQEIYSDIDSITLYVL